MLRLLVGALLLANLLFFTWSRGWLDSIVGIPAQGEREPQRLLSQVRPEQVRLMRPSGSASAAAASSSSASTLQAASAAQSVMPAGSAATDGPSMAANSQSAAASMAARAVPTPPAAASAALRASAPQPSSGPPVTAQAPPSATAPATAASTLQASAAACLEVGPLVPADLDAIESYLKTALPAGSWSQRQTDATGEWMIYMGPYTDRELLERKKRELARIRGGVPQEDVTAPAELTGGISLGRFASQGAASATLAQYNTRGIRTARVVRAGPGNSATYLRVAEADQALARRVSALKLPVAGRSFTACTR